MMNFKDWLNTQQEMTSCASVGGGGTSTSSIARFMRPMGWGQDWEDRKKKREEERGGGSTPMHRRVYPRRITN